MRAVPNSFPRCRFSAIAAALIAIALASQSFGQEKLPTHENPQIAQMVDRALVWLASQNDERLGGKCLIGLSFFKAGFGLDHPKIVAAQAACEAGLPFTDNQTYSLGLALIFLLETNPAKNRSLATRYVDAILQRQQPGGGWGYLGEDQGDTSQTQYPTMALWLAANNGYTVPPSALEKACAWLIRTQDPSGAWGYKGQDPGSLGQRVPQSEIRPALAAAGLGSVFICADALGVRRIEPSGGENAKPSALKPIASAEPKAATPESRAIDPKLIRRAMADGNNWFDRNFTLESEGYTHYYLYALERYYSYRELAEHKIDPNPRWYNELVSMLGRTQMDGHWQGSDNDTIATSFAILALLRSARQTIKHLVADLGQGVLLGGMGLPANAADLREQNGKLIEHPLAGSLDEFIALLENPKTADLDRLPQTSPGFKLDNSITKRSGQITRLRALVQSGSFEARLATIRTLAHIRDFDNVPLLIYALTDPDPRIVREADQGLRFISRKFDGVGLPAEPKPNEVETAIAAWKTWFRSLRPSAEFLN